MDYSELQHQDRPSLLYDSLKQPSSLLTEFAEYIRLQDHALAILVVLMRCTTQIAVYSPNSH